MVKYTNEGFQTMAKIVGMRRYMDVCGSIAMLMQQEIYQVK